MDFSKNLCLAPALFLEYFPFIPFLASLVPTFSVSLSQMDPFPLSQTAPSWSGDREQSRVLARVSWGGGLTLQMGQGAACCWLPQLRQCQSWSAERVLELVPILPCPEKFPVP